MSCTLPLESHALSGMIATGRSLFGITTKCNVLSDIGAEVRSCAVKAAILILPRNAGSIVLGQNVQDPLCQYKSVSQDYKVACFSERV